MFFTSMSPRQGSKPILFLSVKRFSKERTKTLTMFSVRITLRSFQKVLSWKDRQMENILYQMIYFFQKQFILPLYHITTKPIWYSVLILSVHFAGAKVSVVYDTFFGKPRSLSRYLAKIFPLNLKFGVKHTWIFSPSPNIPKIS